MSAQLAAVKKRVMLPNLYVDHDTALKTLRRSKVMTRMCSDHAWPDRLWCRVNFDRALQDAYLKQVVEQMRLRGDGTSMYLRGVMKDSQVQKCLQDAHAYYLSWLARNLKLSTMRTLIDDLGLSAATPRLMANRLLAYARHDELTYASEQRVDMIGGLAVLPGDICTLIASRLLSKPKVGPEVRRPSSSYDWLFRP